MARLAPPAPSPPCPASPSRRIEGAALGERAPRRRRRPGRDRRAESGRGTRSGSSGRRSGRLSGEAASSCSICSRQARGRDVACGAGRLPGALVGVVAARAAPLEPPPAAGLQRLPPEGRRLPAVPVALGSRGSCLSGPQPGIPWYLSDLSVLLQEGGGVGDEEAQFVLHHLDCCGSRPHLLVSNTSVQMKVALEQHLARLNEIFATRGDYVQTLKFLQQMAGNIVLQLSGLPVWNDVTVDLSQVAGEVGYVEYYRWLSYLLLFILDLVICLTACLGLAKHSKCLLIVILCCGLFTLILSWSSFAADVSGAVGTSDFCMAPDKFIMNMTQSDLSAEIVRYYLYCSQSLTNPFQQALTIYQRSLTTMQIQIQGLMQFALPLFPTAEDYLDALIGICYDGVEGLLYLILFSLLAAVSFSTVICAVPRAWKHLASRDRDYDDIDEEDPFNPQARRIAAHNPSRGQLRSFCSYSSSLGSQTSLQPPAQTISNAPVSEYMNQAVLFGGNPRYENVPLIGRGSPPPTYSPSMRATYLSVNDDHRRQHGPQFPA
uniref:Protein tweety homolog n=1 Tax=Podarcis muralis TaxID=64176 RepID=A0A670HSK5_PODMU